MEQVPEALILAFAEGSPVAVIHTECKSVGEVQQWIGRAGGEEVIVDLIQITPELVIKHGGAFADEEAVAGLATLRQMMYLDPIRDVICAIAAEAYELGRKSKDEVQNQN